MKIAKLLSVVLMCMCLTFMTSVNFFLYPSQKQQASVISEGKDAGGSKNDVPPSGPVEEKSSSSGLNILEEFLHDPHPVIEFGIEKQQHLHAPADACKVLVFHGELLSPPPEL